VKAALDDQRYYSSIMGRFLTADPHAVGTSLTSPQTWNRYAYVVGDPANSNDPTGKCTALIAGNTMTPGEGAPSTAAFDREAIDLGGVSAYPYSNMSHAGAAIDNASQALFGPNTSTQVALDALNDALNTNSGSIDVVTVSGGAQAFTTAFGLLSPANQARIGSILYLSPGVGGELVTTPDRSNTTIVLGTGPKDIAATAFGYFPPGVQIIKTPCAHTDVACELRHAQAQLAQMKARGPCSSQDIFQRPLHLMGGGGNDGSILGLLGLGGGGVRVVVDFTGSEITYEDVQSTITYK
jgi:hypothetical protein